MENNNNSNNSLISNLLGSFNIVDVVKNYISVIKKGQNYWALCPFHGDKNPSLSISPNKNIFKCFTCNTKGNAVSFVMLFKKVTFIEAIKEIKTLLNINNPELNKFLNSNSKMDQEDFEIFETNKKAAFFFYRTLFNKESKECLDYLKSRGIDDEIIKFYEIGFAPKSFERNYLQNLFKTVDKDDYDPYKLLKAGLTSLNDNDNFVDFFNNRLIIPIKDEHGNIGGFSGRTLNKNEKIKYINTKTTKVFKKDNLLFNFFAFNKSSVEEIYIVEGYMDVFALRRLGIENVVASMGTSFNQNQINLIKKFPKIKRIILCLDNDFPGSEATIALTEKLMKNGFDVFLVKPYNRKYKDVDELSRALPKDECLKIINNQIGFVEYLIDNIKNLDLNYKEKKIELQNIIRLINDFAYKSEFITDDKKLISNFFEIDLKELDEIIINKNRKRYNQNIYFDNNFQKTNKYQKEIDYFLKKEKEFTITDKNIKKVEFSKAYYEQLKFKESELIVSMIYSPKLANLYFNKLGFLFFNIDNNFISKILKMIIYVVKNNYLKSNYNYELVKKIIMGSEDLTEQEIRYFELLISRWENKIKITLPNNDEQILFTESTINKIFIQGVHLLRDIKLNMINRIINEKKILIPNETSSEAIQKIQKEIRVQEIAKEVFIDEIAEILNLNKN